MVYKIDQGIDAMLQSTSKTDVLEIDLQIMPCMAKFALAREIIHDHEFYLMQFLLLQHANLNSNQYLMPFYDVIEVFLINIARL